MSNRKNPIHEAMQEFCDSIESIRAPPRAVLPPIAGSSGTNIKREPVPDFPMSAMRSTLSPYSSNSAYRPASSFGAPYNIPPATTFGAPPTLSVPSVNGTTIRPSPRPSAQEELDRIFRLASTAPPSGTTPISISSSSSNSNNNNTCEPQPIQVRDGVTVKTVPGGGVRVSGHGRLEIELGPFQESSIQGRPLLQVSTGYFSVLVSDVTFCDAEPRN